jgi:hypothetical protein
MPVFSSMDSQLSWRRRLRVWRELRLLGISIPDEANTFANSALAIRTGVALSDDVDLKGRFTQLMPSNTKFYDDLGIDCIGFKQKWKI